jgi:hypothetical protein
MLTLGRWSRRSAGPGQVRSHFAAGWPLSYPASSRAVRRAFERRSQVGAAASSINSVDRRVPALSGAAHDGYLVTEPFGPSGTIGPLAVTRW